MRCDTCRHWMPVDDMIPAEWEASTAGFGRCKAVRARWDIEEEVTTLLPKYPENEELVEVSWEEVGKRWLDAFKAGFQKERAFVQDASQYKADLYTGPDFFCAKYQEKATCQMTISQK